jgi:hypothetical protein
MKGNRQEINSSDSTVIPDGCFEIPTILLELPQNALKSSLASPTPH